MSLKNYDTKNPLWILVGLLIPPLGLVLYLVWRYDRLTDGKYALVGSIIGFVLYFIGGILFRILLWEFFFQMSLSL